MNSGWSARGSGSSASRLFQSQRSKARDGRARRARMASSTTGGAGRTASAGTSRPAPGRRRSPRGRCPSARRKYDDLEPARAAADDDDRVVARAGTAGRRQAVRHRSAQLRPLVRVAEAARLRLEHPVHDPRVADQEGLDLRARRGRGSAAAAARRRRRSAARRAGSMTSPKNSPRASVARSWPSTTTLRLAVEDHVEAGAGQALAQDARALREERLLEAVRDADRAGASRGRRRSRSRRSRRRSRRGGHRLHPRSPAG